MHVGGKLIATPFLHASADGQEQYKDKRKRQEKAANDKESAPKSREQERENRGSAEECDKHPVRLRETATGSVAPGRIKRARREQEAETSERDRAQPKDDAHSELHFMLSSQTRRLHAKYF